MEVEVVDSGVVGKVLISEGSENIAVNTVIALLLEEGEDKSVLDSYEVKVPIVEAKAETKEAPQVQSESAAPKDSNPSSSNFKTIEAIKPVVNLTQADAVEVKATPVAKKLAEINSVNLALIKGTGPNDRVTKEDVENFLTNASSGDFVVRNNVEAKLVPNNNVRKVIAERLLVAKQTIPFLSYY